MTRLTAPMAVMAALTATLGLAACQQPAETPAAETVPEAAVSPVPSTAEMPSDAPPQEEGALSETEGSDDGNTPCRDSLGEAASARLVERCIAVSPATRPPCNAANPCALIQGEIDRACGPYGPDEARPAECAA